MDNYPEDEICLRDTLNNILKAQMEVKMLNCGSDKKTCLLQPLKKSINNTIPFILYSKNEAFKVDGVTTCSEHHTQKEQFICFTTYIFRIKQLKGDCAKLELLKFINHDTCTPSCCNHVCTPNCQLDCEDVKDLIATGVCITVDLTCFCGIQCLPAVCL